MALEHGKTSIKLLLHNVTEGFKRGKMRVFDWLGLQNPKYYT
jgi:hypothetical protein